MDADVVNWVRFLHITLAAFWVGGDVYFFLLVAPNLRAMGSAGETFAIALFRRGGFGRILFPIAIIAGGFLYVSLGHHADPFRDASTATLTVGAAIAVLVLLTGLLYFLPRERALVKIARAIGPDGPTPEQSQRIQEISVAMDRPLKVAVTFLALAFLLVAGRTVCRAEKRGEGSR